MQIRSGSLVLRRPPIILINHRHPHPCSMHLAIFAALEVLDLRTNTLHGDVPENLNDGSFRAGTACRPSQDRVPSAWWWPAFSHRALGPMPLAACAERRVQWSSSQLKMGSGDREGLPGGGVFRLCLNNDKIIGFPLEDGAAKGRGAFGSSTIPECASTTESN